MKLHYNRWDRACDRGIRTTITAQCKRNFKYALLDIKLFEMYRKL